MDLPVSNEPQKKYRISLVAGLAGVILIAAGVLWFFGYFKIFSSDKGMPAWARDLKGIVRLTLADKKNKNSSSSGGLYVIDLGMANRKAMLNLKDGRLNITEHISPDGLLGVYTSFPSALDKENGQDRPQLFTRNLITGERRQVTQSEALRKRNSEWSPDGQQVTFMAQPIMDEGDGLDLKKWSVFVTDLSGKEQLISDGAYPQWLPDSRRLIILKEDGLYLCFLANSKCERVLDLSSYTNAFLNTKIDLSRDGKMIAYTNSAIGDLILIKILSLEPLRLGVSQVIKARVFWPVFSEDSQYLMAEEVDAGKSSDQMNPRLVVYKLDTLEKATLLSLDNFWQNAMFITDWRD